MGGEAARRITECDEEGITTTTIYMIGNFIYCKITMINIHTYILYPLSLLQDSLRVTIDRSHRRGEGRECSDEAAGNENGERSCYYI